MHWPWQRRTEPGNHTPPARARRSYGSQSRLGDGDVVRVWGFPRYAELLRPPTDDRPLMTPGQAARSAPAAHRQAARFEPTTYRASHAQVDGESW